MTLTPQYGASRLYAANHTTAILAALPHALLTAKPSGDGYLATNPNIENHVALGFYGQGADNATMNIRVSGVKRLIGAADEAALWATFPMFTAIGILSTMVGLANQFITASDRFCDSVAVTANTDVIKTPTSVIAEGWSILKFDCFGLDNILVEMDRNAASATNMNVFAWTF